MSDADARVRLEGRAELLEATRARYRLLIRQLGSMWWQERLRKTASVLREVSRVQREVEQAIDAAGRHAKNEQWPESSALLKCLREVNEQRVTLERLTRKRLGRAAAPLDLAQQLEALEQQVLTAPRLVLPGQRWASAKNLLPWPSAELTPVAAFAERLEGVFARPLVGGEKLSFSPQEFEAVVAGWAAGSRGLDAVWARLERLDVSGVLVRYLRSRARRTPTRGRNSGPEVLLHAEFWRNLALSRIETALESRVGPVVCLETERFAVLRWLSSLDRGTPSPLSVGSAERGALIELAHAVSTLPANRQWAAQWPKLLELAQLADGQRADPDWRRLHDALALLARVLESPVAKAVPPLYRSTLKARPTVRRETPDSLSGVIRAMQVSVSSSTP